MVERMFPENINLLMKLFDFDFLKKPIFIQHKIFSEKTYNLEFSVQSSKILDRSSQFRKFAASATGNVLIKSYEIG